jgi:hypothetical protein
MMKLPDVPIAPAGSPRPARLLGLRRDAALLLTVHERCTACDDMLLSLATRIAEFRAWGGRVIVLACAADEALRLDMAIGGQLTCATIDAADAARIGMVPGSPGAHVIDRFGAVYAGFEPGDAHAFPEGVEVEEWFRFLATQCPECGVPDAPGGGGWEFGPHRAA